MELIKWKSGLLPLIENITINRNDFFTLTKEIFIKQLHEIYHIFTNVIGKNNL